MCFQRRSSRAGREDDISNASRKYVRMDGENKSLDAARRDIELLSRQAERAHNKTEAFDSTVKAAEICMSALSLTADPAQRSVLSTQAKRLLDQAERIKAQGQWEAVVRPAPVTSSGSSAARASVPPTLKEPVSTRELKTKEKILLFKSSYLHGFKFPPWETPPDPAEFELKEGEELFVDSKDLSLSEFQEEVFDGWKRPAEALPPRPWVTDATLASSPATLVPGKIDLVQDASTDCSVVASLCAGITRLERGYGRIFRTTLYPYELEFDRSLSKNGKYVSRLNFNGCYRKVVIDDRLPTSSTDRVIHVVDRRNPGLVWPALVEKAYLKVRGGYDFPGSNSGTDLWILTGWIPEQIFLQSDELDSDRYWRRIFNGFNHGDVLITMGTGNISSQTEKALGLVGLHDYAVLDLKEEDGRRLMLVKNPWCEGPSWRHGTSLQGDDHDSNKCAHDNSGDVDQGTFWMEMSNVIQHFESMYLNWNPGLFKFRQDIHFSWDLTTPGFGSNTVRSRFSSLHRHPQYAFIAPKGGAVWALLCRHFQNAVPADATPEDIENDRFGIEMIGHMSLHAFDSAGCRVLLSHRAIQKGWFVDSPQTLMKLEDCVGGRPYTLVPVEQELPALNHIFTLSLFSNSPMDLAEAVPSHPHSRKILSAWTSTSAGGNAESPTYSINPQFSIKIARRSSMTLLLETTAEDLNVHVKLVHGRGKRVHVIRNKDIIIDSKDYRRGCCLAECDSIEPGEYTIVCSTFEPDQYGEFMLCVESDHPADIAPIPREGAGRLRISLEPAVFQRNQTRLALHLSPRRLTTFYAVARTPEDHRSNQHGQTLPHSLIRISVICGHGANSQTLTSSSDGEYADVAAGVRTSDIDLPAKTTSSPGFWLVLERLVAGVSSQMEQISVELLVDRPDTLGFGFWQVWDD